MRKFRVDIFLHVDEMFSDESDESSEFESSNDDWWRGDTESDAQQEDLLTFRFQRISSVEIQAVNSKTAAAIAYREVVSPRRIAILKEIKTLNFILENESSILCIEGNLQVWPLGIFDSEFLLNNMAEQWLIKVDELN